MALTLDQWMPPGLEGATPLSPSTPQPSLSCPVCGKPAIRSAFEGMLWVHAERRFAGFTIIDEVCIGKVKKDARSTT